MPRRAGITAARTATHVSTQQTSLDPSDGIDILVNNAGRELLLNASLLISNMDVLLTMSVSTKFGPVTCRVVPRAKPPRFGSFLVMDHAQETSSNFSHQPSHCGVLFMYRNEGPAISSPLWAIFDEARNHRNFLLYFYDIDETFTLASSFGSSSVNQIASMQALDEVDQTLTAQIAFRASAGLGTVKN